MSTFTRRPFTFCGYARNLKPRLLEKRVLQNPKIWKWKEEEKGPILRNCLIGGLVVATLFFLAYSYVGVGDSIVSVQVALGLYTLDDHPKLLCHKFTGRLGNEMFQYASILAIANATNRVPVFIGSEHLDKYLKTPTKHPLTQQLLEERCSKVDKVKFEKACCTFEEQLFDLDPSFDYEAELYFQSWKYFHDYNSEVKAALTFKDNIRQEAEEIVKALREKFWNSSLVGIHVRRGDLVVEYNAKLGYPTVTERFLEEIIDFFEAGLHDPVFIVASEDVGWCRKHFPTGHRGLVLENHSPAVDLLVLASMDFVALSFGSYSWWAGYLSSGRVVYKKDLFTGVYNTTIRQSYGEDGSDYVFPGWLGL